MLSELPLSLLVGFAIVAGAALGVVSYSPASADATDVTEAAEVPDSSATTPAIQDNTQTPALNDASEERDAEECDEEGDDSDLECGDGDDG
jgi:hypothetical protein